MRQKHLTNRHSTTNTTWANANSGTNILFQFDDGTYGELDSFQVMPFQSNMTAYTYNSGSSPNEYAMKFQLPFPAKVDAFAAFAVAAGYTSTFDAISSAINSGYLAVLLGRTPLHNEIISFNVAEFTHAFHKCGV